MRCVLFPLQGTQMMKKAVANESKVARACLDTQCGYTSLLRQITIFHTGDMRTCRRVYG